MTGPLVPEVSGGGHSSVRIPPDIDVPMTPRVRRLVDSPPMRHLASLRQLGLVSLVYPGAVHTRLEHSLGVLATAVQVVRSAVADPAADRWGVGEPAAQDAFLLASLLHDAGHWPFCHPTEDISGSLTSSEGGKPVRHEARLAEVLTHPAITEAIDQDWECSVADVLSVIDRGIESETATAPAEALRFYASCLSGPIDVDKLDYLPRDSLHAGVPYGRNFDRSRILAAVRSHPREPRLCLADQARTAAEMMVFARYVMFSEVYWERTVRAATAMLQRVVYRLQHDRASELDVSAWATLSDDRWVDQLRRAGRSAGDNIAAMIEGLFGDRRELYRPIAQYDVATGAAVHGAVARQPYWWLTQCAGRLAHKIGDRIGRVVDADEVLIDAPPVKLEVDINLDILTDGGVMSLGELSPVALALANRQFDNHVKRVRVFVPQSLRTDWMAAGLDAAAAGALLMREVDNLSEEMA